MVCGPAPSGAGLRALLTPAGRFELRETGHGVTCRICGYTLKPGEADKVRLFRLLKEEEKGSRRK